MAQFNPGESRTGRVMMRNPTGKDFEYTGYIYLGTDLAVVSEQVFSLVAGGEKQVSFPVVMPGQAGTYPVHIGIFSGGENIALYKAEDVAIVMPDYGNFIYTVETYELRPLTEIDPDAGSAYRYIVYRCRITNQAAMSGTRVVSFWWYYYSTYYNKYYPAKQIRTFPLTLNPEETYSFAYGSIGRMEPDDPVFASGSFRWYLYLKDDAGAESEHVFRQ